MREHEQILLVAQRDADVDEPNFDDLYGVGTLSNILQLLKLPDGTVKVLVEGEQRSQVKNYLMQDGTLWHPCCFAGRDCSIRSRN